MTYDELRALTTNFLAVKGDDLYIITTDGRIMRANITQTLSGTPTWETYYTNPTDEEFWAIAYDSQADAFYVSTHGQDAQVIKLTQE